MPEAPPEPNSWEAVNITHKTKCRLTVLLFFTSTVDSHCRLERLPHQLHQVESYSIGCTDNVKTTASDCIRDTIVMILKRETNPPPPLEQLIRQQSQVETEPTKIIKDLPKQHPFDLAFRVEHTTTDHMWRCPLSLIGFDVTLIHSNISSTNITNDCKLLNNNEPSAPLRDLGEKKKFEMGCRSSILSDPTPQF